MRFAKVAVLAIACLSAAFAGTVTGSLVFMSGEITVADAPGVAVFMTTGQMREFLSGGLDITAVATGLTAAPWNFEVTYDFSDDSSYWAFGGAVPSLADLTGGNFGISSSSPIHTVGGNASDVEIEIDDTVDVTVVVRPGSIPFTNILADMFDYTAAVLSGDPSMFFYEATYEVTDTICIFENVAAGIKQIRFYQDENRNREFDEGELYAFAETMDTSVVMAVYGGERPEFQAVCMLDPAKVESSPRVMAPSMSMYPSPFNSELIIDLGTINTSYRVEISDMRGTVVHSATSNTPIYKWQPASQPSGIYTVRATFGNKIVEKKAIYIK